MVVIDVRIFDLALAGVGESFDVQACAYFLLVCFGREFLVYIPLYLTALLTRVIEFPGVCCKSL